MKVVDKTLEFVCAVRGHRWAGTGWYVSRCRICNIIQPYEAPVINPGAGYGVLSSGAAHMHIMDERAHP